jgi:hypothetical protein
MNVKPVEKFNTRGELYFQCPYEGCAWTFSTAVRLNKSVPAPAEYAKQLNQEFAEHLKQVHGSGL